MLSRKKDTEIKPRLNVVGAIAVKFLLYFLFFVVSIAVFTYVAVHFLDGGDGVSFTPFDYYIVQLNYLRLNLLWLVAVFFIFVLSFNFVFEIFKKSKYRVIMFPIELGLNLFLSLGAVLLGLVFSLLGTFIVCLNDLNRVADAINGLNYGESIVVGVDSIRARLDSDEGLPKIITGRDDVNREIINIEFSDVDNRGEYFKNVIPDMIPPGSYPYLKISNEPVFLYDDSLFITKVDIVKFEEISLSLASAMVSAFFEDRDIRGKGLPEFDVVGRDEYMEDRREMYEEFIEEYQQLAEDVDELISERRSGSKRINGTTTCMGASFGWMLLIQTGSILLSLKIIKKKLRCSVKI